MAASGAGSMREALSVGRAFLASPAATRVAAGSNVRNTVVVKAFYKDKAGRPCRVVEQTVMINGQNVRADGKVCRKAGGQWALAP
jgi:surface antigen